MQWEVFDQHWDGLHSDAGGPVANSGRLVAGLLMLKHMEGLSDERLVEAWVTNPYYQYFCGEARFQHQPPINPITLIKWRKRLGEEGMEWLLTTVIETAVSCDLVKRESFEHVCIDSTVMEKNIAYPTDSRLLENLRDKLVCFLREHELNLRQSYSREGPRLAQKVGRYAHAKQFKRMRKCLKKQCTWVGRLQRELERQIDSLNESAQVQAKDLIALAKQVIAQSRNPRQKEKVYSLHERDVDCISKGKARKRYEFGSKVGIVATQKEGFVSAIRSFPGNPYDGHTLDEQLQQSETLTQVSPKTVAVDLGYRGRHETEAQIIHRGKKLSKRQKKRLKRRSMIEAMIGHMKVDGLLERCHLKGLEGDAIHAILCGVGHNLRLLRAHWKRVLLWLKKMFRKWSELVKKQLCSILISEMLLFKKLVTA